MNTAATHPIKFEFDWIADEQAITAWLFDDVDEALSLEQVTALVTSKISSDTQELFMSPFLDEAISIQIGEDNIETLEPRDVDQSNEETGVRNFRVRASGVGSIDTSNANLFDRYIYNSAELVETIMDMPYFTGIEEVIRQAGVYNNLEITVTEVRGEEIDKLMRIWNSPPSDTEGFNKLVEDLEKDGKGTYTMGSNLVSDIASEIMNVAKALPFEVLIGGISTNEDGHATFILTKNAEEVGTR